MVLLLHKVSARVGPETERETVLYSKQFDKLFSQRKLNFGDWDAEENRMDKGGIGERLSLVRMHMQPFACEKNRFAQNDCLQTDGRRTPRDCIRSWN